ncbi:MAG TPA: hypothetical protein VFP68_06615 [Burkholderiaceae bacterium]|nr:hypothetical protein [Burkholderiaceae bacterium]
MLAYLSISTVEVCEYPDSGKYGVVVRGEGGLRAMHRTDSDLDYWDGEP